MGTQVKVKGLGQLSNKLAKLSQVVIDNLPIAVEAGLLPIRNEAVDQLADTSTHPDVTGTLSRSITIEVRVVPPTSVEGRAGTNVEYAAIEEERDGHSYLGTAVNLRIDQVQAEVFATLKALVRSAAS